MYIQFIYNQGEGNSKEKIRSVGHENIHLSDWIFVIDGMNLKSIINFEYS